MALQATFVGNWQQFDQTMENAKKNIVAFEVPVKGLQRELQRMVSSIDGSKMAREAATAAAAIEKIGGVTKLTDSEQRKLNATVQETVDKYKAMGSAVPAEVKKVADELQKAVKASDDLNDRNKKSAESMLSLSGIAKSVGGVLAGAFTIGAVVNFGKELVDLGGQITDLSERTGISTDVIQELKYAADQTGTTIENVTSSIEKMGINLSRGEKGTVAAVKDLGLSLESLWAMRPEEAFSTIADEIAKIPDPMRQADLATQLLGKSAAEALPAMKAGIRELREEAHELGQVLSKEAVASLDEFGDKWAKVMGGLKVSAAEAVLDIGKAFSDLPNILDTALAAGRLGLGPGGIGAAAALVGSGDRVRDNRQRTEDIKLPPEVAKAAADYAEQLRKVREELAALPEATKRQIIAAKELKTVNEEDIAKGLKISVEAVKLYLEGLKDLEGQQRKLASLSLTANFQETIAKAKQWVKEIDTGRISVADLGTKQQEVNKHLREAEQAMKAVGATGDPLYRRIVDLATATTDWAAMLPKVKTGIDDILKVAGQAAATKVPSGTLLDIMFGDAGKLGGIKLGIPGDLGIKVDNADKQFAEWFKEGHKSAIDLSGSIDDLSRAFAQLAQARPLEGWIQDVAELIGLMNVATQSGKGFADAIRKRDKDGKVITGPDAGFDWSVLTGSQGAGNAIAAGTQLAQFGVNSVAAVSQATDVAGRGNRTLRGAATGASIGANPALMAATGGWSVVVGAVAGAIIGALRNPGFEQEMKRIANEFGVNISEKLAREIDKLKKQFGGDRAAAEIFSLDKIIADAGGLSDKNFGTMTGKLRDVFVMVETGKFAVEDARNVLDRSFGLFVTHFQKGNEIASQSFQDIIRLNKEMGINSEAVGAFVNQQTQALGNSVANLAAPLVGKNESFKERITTAQKAVSGAGSDEERARAAENLNVILAQQREFAAGSADELERLGVIALGSFNAAVNSGADWLTAVENMGPALDTLIGLQKDLGLESQNAGLAELTRFRDLVNNNQELVLSTQALGETMKALSSIGGITVDTLAAMEAQGGQTFDRLIAAGFSENQALTQMKGFLLNVMHAHEQLGTPIDENTAKLIEMARQQGLFKDEGKDTADILKSGFKDMKDGTDKLVGSIGLMIKALGKDVPESVQDAIDALDKIPRNIDINARVNYNDPGWTPPSGGDGGGTPTWDGPSARNGGIIDAGSGTLTMLHGKEAIIPLDRLGGGGAGTRVIHVHLETDGREFAHAVVPFIPDVLALHGVAR